MLLLWELIGDRLQHPQFLLPRPSAILDRLPGRGAICCWTPRSTSLLFEATGATFREALGGFVLGCGSGILLALITARWTVVSEATMPFAIAANSVPIIAFAPIMNNWFGITNPVSKMAIVAIIVFFPTMINTVRGLTLVDPRQLELMHSYAASPTKILRALRIPNALPYIFSALRVASPLSLIGASRGRILRWTSCYTGGIHHAGSRRFQLRPRLDGDPDGLADRHLLLSACAFCRTLADALVSRAAR